MEQTKQLYLETWELYGAFIDQVDYGDMNYATSDPAMIALTVDMIMLYKHQTEQVLVQQLAER